MLANCFWPLASTELCLIYSKSHNWKVIFLCLRTIIKLWIVSWLEVVHCVYFSMLRFCLPWVRTSYVCYWSLWVNMYIFSVVSQKCCLVEVIQQCWLLEFFCCLFLIVLWVLKTGSGMLKTSHLWLRALKSLCLCTLSNCGYLCWFFSIRRGFSDENWGIQ